MSATADTYHVLFYDFVEDYLERRAEHRDVHLALVYAERDAGRVVLAGALGDPPTRAAIIFKGVDTAHIDRFASGDPYVALGLVKRREIVPYKNVL